MATAKRYSTAGCCTRAGLAGCLRKVYVDPKPILLVEDDETLRAPLTADDRTAMSADHGLEPHGGVNRNIMTRLDASAVLTKPLADVDVLTTTIRGILG